MTDWIEWNGGTGHAPGKRVEVQFRAYPGKNQGGDRAEEMRWSHIGYNADIIAYRIVKEPAHCRHHH
jgi:hypothetical protein